MTTELTLLSRVAYRDQEVTGPRLRGLLALLAGDLRPGCSTARLVEGLWPEVQPENPTKALQVLISRARSQLGADLIANTPTGYRLTLTDQQVDASAVLLKLSSSAQKARAGDHAASLASAQAGLACWEGAEPPDVVHDDPVSALRADRWPTYGALGRLRALALSRLGRRAEAFEALRELVRAYPRDEELFLELLSCEAVTAGPAAALARYDAYRRTLRDELGADPGGALQSLHRRLLQDDAPAVRHGVPHEPNSLLGRDEDLGAVAGLVRTSRVTSIVGPGGLGKTRLAHVVSRQAEQRVVHFVALAGVSRDDDVAAEVASVLGVGDGRRASVGQLGVPADVLAGIANALGPAPTLLVLDNCEQVIRGVAELVRALVSMTRDLRILTTSRSPLGLSSESVYLLPGLSVPTSVELFERRARAARPGVDLPAVVVAELCGQLDGLPLAVELAAARVRVLSVPEIARRLRDRFGLLRGGPRDAPQRHRTLYAVVDWSWNLLDPAGQAAMRALSVFPGGFTAEAADHLLGADALGVVEDLVDQSLVEVTDTGSGTRFRMLETVREFSAAHREAAGESDRVLDGFLTWARDFGVAQHEAPFGPGMVASCELIRAEQDNLLLALRLGLARSDGAVVAATSAALGSLWIAESNYTRLAALGLDDIAWLLSHYRPAPELVEVTRASLTVSMTCNYIFQGLPAVRSLVTLRRLPSAPPTTVVRAIAVVLAATPGMADPDLAVLRSLCESEEPLVSAAAYGITTYAYEQASDLQGALSAAQGMLVALDPVDHPLLRGMAHARIGELCMQLERGAEADRHLREALRIQEELGGRSDMAAQFRWGLVLVNLQVGAIDEAERWLAVASADEAEAITGTLTFSRGVQAEIALARGEVDAGLRLWRQAVDGLGEVPSLMADLDPGTAGGSDPWTLEIQAAAVAAHGYHGRSDLVEDLLAGLPQRLTAMLANPRNNPPAYLMEHAICGALLLALAIVDLERAERTGDRDAARVGVRMVAVAERLKFVRNFHPTMSSERARRTAERADRSAYAAAVSSYAGLDIAGLRAEALAALQERDQRERAAMTQRSGPVR